MGGTPGADATIFYHGLIALMVPLGWAVILYPYWRLHRQDWYKTLIFVAVLSLSFMVAKEIYLDREISSDDIAADLLGLFFGTGLGALLLYIERAVALSRKKTDDQQAVPHEDDTAERDRRAPGTVPAEISLRDIMGVLAKIHARGGLLFEEAAENSTDRQRAELCRLLAAEKQGHVREVASLLERWSNKPPDVNTLDWMDDRINKYEIYSRPVPGEATDREIIEYAVGQEKSIHTLFSGLHRHFEGYSWRSIQFENMILELKGHTKRFEALCPGQEAAKEPAWPSRPNSRAPQPAAVPDRKGKTANDGAILVVDDEEAVRTAIAEYLMGDGFSRVDTAADGQEAIDLFEKQGHDVVIVDIAMPKRHGLEVLKTIKAKSPRTQVIIITGRGAKDSAIAALRLGALDYIEKPFDFAVLSRTVSNGLGRKNAHEENR